MKNNVIESAFFFKLVALSLKLDKKVKAGEYLFENKTSLYNTFKKINSGDPYFRKFVVIEGTTTEKIINDLNANLYLSGKINKKIEEGTLFPETYFFLRNDNREKLLFRMQKKMHETIDDIWSSKKSFIDSKEKLIKLASLIEAETKLNSEKYIVSSVFHNRIKLNMRLQSDPTVLYAKNLNNKKKSRKIYKNDLKKDSPWNTYTNKGLPLTPICNPGLVSLKAAANPALTDYVYFVSDGNNGHLFSTNIDQHNKNVNIFRKIMNKKANEKKAN